ncbi:MAG: hypothetical protein JWM65_3953 [Sphingomonas bacterium]|nr:hypothetical protein [Sphingomonas bacterium]
MCVIGSRHPRLIGDQSLKRFSMREPTLPGRQAPRRAMPA